MLEVTIKQMLGKLSIPGSVAEAASEMGLTELAFTARHAEGLAGFPALRSS